MKECHPAAAELLALDIDLSLYAMMLDAWEYEAWAERLTARVFVDRSTDTALRTNACPLRQPGEGAGTQRVHRCAQTTDLYPHWQRNCKGGTRMNTALWLN